ncbi:MAG: response regulator transcription factor [Chloroflexi bacterium]|nr:response regulator transcription factor [Chloroflexota bacterium]
MEPIRLLIADDHTFYREGVRAMLRGAAEIEVISEATTGDEAVAKTLDLQPDIILMDIKMPGLNGIEATRRILQASPHIGVLVITMFVIRYFAALQPTAAVVFPELTEREREILHLIAQGHSNPEIANRLVLSLKTVQNHVSNIFSKLQVADRSQAIVRAREAGLGQ